MSLSLLCVLFLLGCLGLGRYLEVLAFSPEHVDPQTLEFRTVDSLTRNIQHVHNLFKNRRVNSKNAGNSVAPLPASVKSASAQGKELLHVLMPSPFRDIHQEARVHAEALMS